MVPTAKLAGHYGKCCCDATTQGASYTARLTFRSELHSNTEDASMKLENEAGTSEGGLNKYETS